MAEKLTPEQVAEIEQRAENATPGPWQAKPLGRAIGYVRAEDGLSIANGHGEWYAEDAEFTAAARSDVPALLAHIYVQEAEITRLRTVLLQARDALGAEEAIFAAAGGEEAAIRTEDWKYWLDIFTERAVAVAELKRAALAALRAVQPEGGESGST